MKTGRSLQELAAELERQRETRRDYVAPQGKLEAVVVDDVVNLGGMNGHAYGITDHAHRQIADHLAIPQRYYDRMRTEHPDLLARNINTWLHDARDEQRMIRTLDGKVRAVMSPKYRPLDNFELATSVLPKLIDMNAVVTSCELTETRMYIKGILPDLSDELPAGAVWGTGHQQIADYRNNEPGKVVSALTISNSEVGAGSLRVEPSVFTTWCSNLAIIKGVAMKKYHVGRAFDVSEDFGIYRDETREANDRAFWMKVQDVTAAAFDRRVFEAAVAEIRNATQLRIESDDLPAVVETAVKVLDLPSRASNGILKMLAAGGDMSAWGLASAVTAVANTTDSYELATDLERAGGEILALRGRAWERIGQATSAA